MFRFTDNFSRANLISLAIYSEKFVRSILDRFTKKYLSIIVLLLRKDEFISR